MKTNNKQPYTATYQMGAHKTNANYKWQFFIDSLQTNQQLRQYLLVTTLVALAVVIVAGSLLIPLGIKLIGWLGAIG